MRATVSPRVLFGDTTDALVVVSLKLGWMTGMETCRDHATYLA